MRALRITVNGVDCDVPVETARELAARARAVFEGPERPLHAVAVYLEACCESGLPVNVLFTDREEADLGWAIDSWELEVGHFALPPEIRVMRDALRRQAA